MEEREYLTAQEAADLSNGYRNFDCVIRLISKMAYAGRKYVNAYLLKVDEIEKLESLGYVVKQDTDDLSKYKIEW